MGPGSLGGAIPERPKVAARWLRSAAVALICRGPRAAASRQRPQVSQPVVVAGNLVHVTLPHALVPQQPQVSGNGIVVVVTTPPSPVVTFFVV